MAILSEASRILSTSQGTLVYHLVVLWAVIASLAIAIGEWKRARDERAQRLLLAMGGLVAVRGVYVLAALIVSANWFDPEALLPPLERFVDTASIGFLAWAFMPPLRRRVRIWDWMLGLNLVLAVAVCVVFTNLWGQALAVDATLDYNDYWQATVWMLWQSGLMVLAGFAAVWNHGEGWGTFVVAIFFMFVGVWLDWLNATDVPTIAVWQRMTNLVAYPLIAVAIFQEVVTSLRVRSLELQDISQVSLDQIKSLLNLFEAGKRASSSLDLSTVLDSAVRGIARILDADQCAIVFPEEGDSSTMRLVAIYNPTRQGRGEAVTFPLEYQLTVQQAIRRKKAVIVEGSDNVQLKVLFALLGSAVTGPLLVQPLLDSKGAMGAIIAGNSRSRRPFTGSDAKLCQSIAEQVAAAVRNARLYGAAQGQIQELNKAQTEGGRELQQAKAKLQDVIDSLTEARAEVHELRVREEAAREARNALEIRLVTSRAEVDMLSARVGVLETDLAQVHARTEAQSRWYEEEMARLQAEWGESVPTAESLEVAVRGMTAGVLVTDVQGVIQEVNLAAEILLDLGIEELKGKTLEDLGSDERWRQAVATARGGEAVRQTIQIGVNTLMCDLAPLPGPPGLPHEPHGLVAVVQDVSAEIEEERARSDGIASLVEELRTPVTTIINYADLLLSETVGILGNAQRKFITRIRASADRLVQMADGLAREMGAMEQWTRPQHQLVDVNKLIETTVAGTHYQLEDRSITLELDLPDDLPPINADPDYLQRVLSNLLSNACLASSAGGQIHVQTVQSPTSPLGQEGIAPNGDGFVIISIKDSGGGVPDEVLSQVFERGRPSQTPPGLGESGAELAVVKMLVEAHGGHLWVESEQGVGTTFSFVLPVNEVGEHSGQRAEQVV